MAKQETLVQGRVHANEAMSIGGRLRLRDGPFTAIDFTTTAYQGFLSAGRPTPLVQDPDMQNAHAVVETGKGEVDFTHDSLQKSWCDLNGCAGGGDPDTFDVERYAGLVATRAQGVTSLEPPDPVKRAIRQPLDVRGSKNATAAKGLQTRALLEPVDTGGTHLSERMKLAYNADLRIIDGVWYLRNPANPLS